MSELPPSGTDITLIQDEQGILFLGDGAELEPWLTEQGLVSREWRSRAAHTAFVTGTGVSAVGNLAGQSGRWVKMTKDSAKLAQQYGLDSGVLRNSSGRIVKHVQFDKLASHVGPGAAAGIGGVMAQYALEQSIKEITEYLATIDKKVDDLLQDQKDQAIADLAGIALTVQEALAIRDKVGGVSETTWSKVAGGSQVAARAQAYALIKIAGLTKKLEKASSTNDIAAASRQLADDVPVWLAVLAQALQLQDRLSVVELERALADQPETVEQHRIGVVEARKHRIHTIGAALDQLTGRMIAAADRARPQKLLHPLDVDTAIAALAQASNQLADFGEHAGIDVSRASIQSALRWHQVANEFVDNTATGAKRVGSKTGQSAREASSRAALGAKKIGGSTYSGVRETGQKLSVRRLPGLARKSPLPQLNDGASEDSSYSGPDRASEEPGSEPPSAGQ